MIVANVVPRPPRTEMVKQKRPKKAQNPLQRRSTQTDFDTFWKRPSATDGTASCQLRVAAWASVAHTPGNEAVLALPLNAIFLECCR